MRLYCILYMLLLVTVAVEIEAVPLNVTSATGTPSNNSLDGPGWEGPAHNDPRRFRLPRDLSIVPLRTVTIFTTTILVSSTTTHSALIIPRPSTDRSPIPSTTVILTTTDLVSTAVDGIFTPSPTDHNPLPSSTVSLTVTVVSSTRILTIVRSETPTTKVQTTTALVSSTTTHGALIPSQTTDHSLIPPSTVLFTTTDLVTSTEGIFTPTPTDHNPLPSSTVSLTATVVSSTRILTIGRSVTPTTKVQITTVLVSSTTTHGALSSSQTTDQSLVPSSTILLPTTFPTAIPSTAANGVPISSAPIFPPPSTILPITTVIVPSTSTPGSFTSPVVKDARPVGPSTVTVSVTTTVPGAFVSSTASQGPGTVVSAPIADGPVSPTTDSANTVSLERLASPSGNLASLIANTSNTASPEGPPNTSGKPPSPISTVIAATATPGTIGSPTPTSPPIAAGASPIFSPNVSRKSTENSRVPTPSTHSTLSSTVALGAAASSTNTHNVGSFTTRPDGVASPTNTPTGDSSSTTTAGNLIASTALGSPTPTRASRKSPPNRGGIVIPTATTIGCLIAIAIAAALAKLAHAINQAKKAGKPGASPSKSREFVFLFPPYLPRPKKNEGASQIALTLTPVDIEAGYTYQQIVWQRFNRTEEFSVRLDYDRGFGTANIRNSNDRINGISFSDPPLSCGHAKPGRPIPLRGSAWAKALDFITWKHTRIIARNENHVPLRLVIGSYICEGSNVSTTNENSEHADEDVERGEEDPLWGHADFQSFVLIDKELRYQQELSASFDLILRAYKIPEVEVGQILSPTFLREKAVPLLGEKGLRVNTLPKRTTWHMINDGSELELKMQRPAWRKYF